MSAETVAQRIAHLAHTDSVTTAHNLLRGLRSAIALQKPAVDSAAADVTDAYEATADEQSDVQYFPLAFTVTSAKLMPFAALTADASNYATVTVEYDDGAGGSDTAVATLVTDVAGGSWVAGTAKTMTLTSSAPVNIPAGSYVHFSIAKAGTGVAVPVFKIFLDGKLT